MTELTYEWRRGPGIPFNWKLSRDTLLLRGERWWVDEVERERRYESQLWRCALVDFDAALSHVEVMRDRYRARWEAERNEKLKKRKF